MTTGSISFIYKDAHGLVSGRELDNVSETDNYIQGICRKSGDLRTFRKDRILENITDLTTLESRVEYYRSINPPHTENKSKSRPRNTLGNPEVCFTGFKKDDKDKLIALAKSNGLFVCSTVTSNLDFLCCGYNAGPSKIEKARHQGVIALNDLQFISMLETGEIPEK